MSNNEYGINKYGWATSNLPNNQVSRYTQPSYLSTAYNRAKANWGIGSYGEGLTRNVSSPMNDSYYTGMSSGGTYTPEMTAQAMKDAGYSSADIDTVYKDGVANSGTTSSDGVMGGVGTAFGAITAAADLAKGWAAYEGVQAQKEANAENKASNIANFNMSADQFNAQIDRANNINNQIATTNKGVAGYIAPKTIESVQKRA